MLGGVRKIERGSEGGGPGDAAFFLPIASPLSTKPQPWAQEELETQGIPVLGKPRKASRRGRDRKRQSRKECQRDRGRGGVLRGWGTCRSVVEGQEWRLRSEVGVQSG